MTQFLSTIRQNFDRTTTEADVLRLTYDCAILGVTSRKAWISEPTVRIFSYGQ